MKQESLLLEKTVLMKRWTTRYGLAVVVTAVAFALRLALSGILDTTAAFVTFYPAVMIVAMVGGFGPGLLAVALTLLMVDYWIFPPAGQFSPKAAGAIAAITIFSFTGTFMSICAGLYHRLRRIAAQYEKELALRESEERFTAFMDSIPAVAWLKDESGRHLYMNKRWEEMFGVKQEDWIGKTEFDLVSTEAAEKVRERDLAVLKSGKPVEDIHESIGPNGEISYWHSIRFPFGGLSGQRFLGGIEIDITRQKQTEDALKNALKELEARTADLEAANESLAASNEEITAANEELAAANEELRITTEELNREIEERKRAEEETHSMALFPNENPNPVMRISENGDLLYSNAAGKVLMELWEQSDGSPLPEDLLKTAANTLKAGVMKELDFPCGDRTISFIFAPILKQGYVNLYGRNISKRVMAERALRESNQRLELFSNTVSRLLLSDDPQGLVQSLCEHVMETLDCQIFINFLVDEGKGRLHLNACAGIPEEIREQMEWLDFGVTVCGYVAREGQRVIVEDIPDNPDPKTDMIKGLGIQAYACHPLLARGGRIIGTLSFGTRTRTHFSDDEISLIKAVADHVAMAIEKIQLLNAVRQRAEELQAVLDAVPAAVWIAHDPQCLKITGNSYADRIMQVQQGSNISLSAPPEDQAVSYKVFRDGVELKPEEMPAQVATATGKPVAGEVLEIVFDDGRRIHLLEGAVPLTDAEGRIRGAVAAGADVTPLKQAEERERERELEAHKKEFYQRTILAATEGKLLIAEKQDILKLASNPIKSWRISDNDSFAKMRDEVNRLTAESGFDQSMTYQFLGCVVEAAGNAIKHAKGGEASLCRTEDSLIFVISDNGPGIGALALPHVALTRNYSTAGTLGMGYKLMIKFADMVYLSTGPEGTTVAIEMKLQQAANASASPQ